LHLTILKSMASRRQSRFGLEYTQPKLLARRLVRETRVYNQQDLRWNVAVYTTARSHKNDVVLGVGQWRT